MIIEDVRHGPKNNDPNAHGTGVEALLDSESLPVIREYARSKLQQARSLGYKTLRIETTSIDRGEATGLVAYEAIRNEKGIVVASPRIDDLIGSSEVNPLNQKAINLGHSSMSKIWGESKKRDKYNGVQGEHRPLLAWCEKGFDNFEYGWNPFDNSSWNLQDPGISLREIAWRHGAYLYRTLTSSDQNDFVIAFGHSGDMEPWLYLTLEMIAGNDDGKTGASSNAMVERFHETAGALEPLTGFIFDYSGRNSVILEYNFSSGNKIERVECVLNLEILQKQNELFQEYGISQKVLEAKIREFQK